MKKINFAFIFSFAIFFVSFTNVSGQSVVGVSPGNIEFNDVLRGGYAQRPILISLDSEEEVLMSVQAWGDVASWLNFSENESVVSKGKNWRLNVMVNPPRDIPNGNYTAFVRVRSDPLTKESGEGTAASSVKAVIDAQVIVRVSDREIKECTASSFNVLSVEKGDDLEFIVNVLNQGNIRLKPEFSLDFWDQDQINLVKTENYISNEILPTTTSEIKFRVDTDDLEIGQYWVDFKALDCFDSETLTFDVLEEGALRAEEVITGIITKTWAEIGETVPIEISFKNIGEKEIDAQFRGKIMYGDKVVNILESPVSSVSVSDDTNFSFYYTPSDAGKYIISGRVFYDKKRTFESSAILNVKPKTFTIFTVLLYLLYALIFASLVYLFYRVRKERIIYSNKLRRLSKI